MMADEDLAINQNATQCSAAGGGEHADALCAWSLWTRIAQGSPRDGIGELQLLLTEGHNLFAADSRGRTCAHLACEHARGWELHFLLAIERGSRQRAPEELRQQITLLHARTHRGETLLHVAASRGFVPVIRYLLTAWNGHELNGRNSSGRTALHEAAAKGHFRVVKLLLQAGADVNVDDLEGLRPVQLAAGSETQQLLRDAQDKLQLMRQPRYGIVAYFRCEASYALDRVLTPLAYSLADTYVPPPLRPQPMLVAAAVPVLLAIISFVLAVPLSLLLIAAVCIGIRALPQHVLTCSSSHRSTPVRHPRSSCNSRNHMTCNKNGGLAQGQAESDEAETGLQTESDQAQERVGGIWCMGARLMRHVRNKMLFCLEDWEGQEGKGEGVAMEEAEKRGYGVAGRRRGEGQPVEEARALEEEQEEEEEEKEEASRLQESKGREETWGYPRINQREAAVGFWRGCVVVFVGVGLCLYAGPSLLAFVPTRLQQLTLTAFLSAAACMAVACAATSGADPGLVEWDALGLAAALQHVMDYGAPPGDYDAVSMLRRPLRSKICRVSGGACIARFDHFCIWINRPIGAGNHLLFLTFVALQALALFLFLCLASSILRSTDGDSSWWMSVWWEPPRAGLLLLSLFALVVEALLLFLLLFQLRNVAKNLTTNEFLNMERYPHFWRGRLRADGKRSFSNPFDKGLVGNVNEFLGIGGRVEYVRLFSSGLMRPGPRQWRRATAEWKRDDTEEELQVLVVPTGWSSGETEQGLRWLPPALPFEMPGVASPSS